MMRVIAFIRSLLIVVVVGVVVPVALAVAGEWRFGGASPLHGVPAPDRWSADALRALLAEPLTDRTLADVAVRTAFVVGWLAVLVFVLTVVAETAHLIRHGGHHLPDVRGLRWSQRGARVIAAGLVALLPVLTQASAVIAAPGGSDPSLLGRPASVLPVAAPADSLTPASAPTQSTHVTAVAGDYVVRAGDSVFGIARQLAGPDDHAVAVYADHILDLNLGREMSAGQRFTNPGLIDVGWVLQLPAVDAEAGGATTPPATSHTVLPGESLWSIADDELGDPRLWPELFDANSGRTFDDGRTLVDPALLRPGWDLVVPGPSVGADDSHHVDAEAPVVIDRQEPTAPVSTPAVVDHDAHHVDAAPAGQTFTFPSVEDVAPALLDHNDDAAGPENVWAAAPGTSDVIADVNGAAAATQAVAIDDSSPQLLTIRRAAMLVGGVLTLVAVRRRRRLREAPPRARLPQPVQRAESLEHELRNVTAGEGVARVDLAIRAATLPLVESGRRLLAAFAGADGTIEIVSSGPAVLPAMWRGAGDRWTLPASVALETIAADARRVNAPCPALVQLGVDDSGRDVYVDLEAISALEIGGSDAARGAIVAAIAATLAGSVLAEVTTLVSVAVPADAFLGHRLHMPATDIEEAYEVARNAVGAMSAMQQPAFELRARGTGGESWDPAVVLVGPGAGTLRLPGPQPGLAVVSASPIDGPSSTLRPDGDAWLLRPLGVRLQPVGLVPDDLSAISELVNVEPAEGDACGYHGCGELDGDCTIYELDEPDDSHHVVASPMSVPAARGWDIMVRLFGSIEAVDRDGNKAAFERSKTTELVAWLATHRDRSTRANARTALWEQDVRDATFANVVSEARRALARLLPPPEGEEWVGRTLTEALPLHSRVTTDAELLAGALAESRGQPPERAIALLRGPVEAIAGLPFEGTSYLWPDGEGLTSNLILTATSAAAELAARCLAVGDTEGVFEATARGLRVLPGHEELIGLRMRAHARAGDHAAVRQEWNSYERVVNADPWSDGEPSPKLVDLRKELLHPSV